MALTSSSTFNNAYDQLNNNHDWPGFPARARAWLEAVRWLEGNRPNFSMRQNSQIGWLNLEKDKQRAHEYVLSLDTSASRSPFVKGKSRYGA